MDPHDFNWFSPATPSLSDSSPTSTSSSPFFPTTPVLGSTSTLLLPISPPAPHRKAPTPPKYTPKRRRARHMNMREPARNGLFTVSEVDENEDEVRSVPATPELDHSISACTSESGCETPGYESEDPFAFDNMWRAERVESMFGDQEEMGLGLGFGLGLGIGIEMSRTFSSRPSSKTPRRPPPLSLILTHHPYQLAPPPAPSPSRCAAPKMKPSALLPSLPILPPPAYAPSSPRTPTLPRRKTNHTRDDDLLLRFAELLESCGEDTGSETFGFPLPPTRAKVTEDLPWSASSSALSFGSSEPKTPRSARHRITHRRSPPAPPIRTTHDKVSSWQRDLSPPSSPLGSHSMSSRSSGSSRSLPKRAPIPWECKM